jgi:SAM-dependent methyltransferase
MNNQVCNVCGNFLDDKIYSASANKSLTSLSVAANNPTEVFFCHNCDHLQTSEYGDESSYYDVSYNILSESEEEDQIYIVKNGKPIYRTEHQVSTLLSKVDINDGMQILDYGCAKSSTMAQLLLIHQNADIHLYDISSKYLPFWDKFLDQSKCSTYSIPDNWFGKFDLVTSFFSLEHISNLEDVFSQIKRLLKKGGTFYAVIPNFLTNIADLIVVDHPNHFTKSSINHLLSINGFVVENIDDESHRGALVITAKLEMQDQVTSKEEGVYNKAVEISKFWTDASKRVSEFEDENKSLNSAIYGAGFYGAFLAANIKMIGSIKFIIDQNPYLHGKYFFGRKVISPNELPDTINTVYVGLNPTYSKTIIQDIQSLSTRHLKYFYL